MDGEAAEPTSTARGSIPLITGSGAAAIYREGAPMRGISLISPLAQAVYVAVSIEKVRRTARQGDPIVQTARSTFVPPAEQHQARTALVSYPRSGNSWVRQLLERATGMVKLLYSE